ncbi:ABC transporter ATP-binding protein [Arthrobacter sp. MA-N2]|uniref:ABC transporter ATP-binding protein n=1 Tax=Arthrobacter sp. MA-N2 TaxID=1101188 RepID=UPI000487A754|nr:ABC transporter ATP-binding protein [Arthrobacter sp. MA-N2]
MSDAKEALLSVENLRVEIDFNGAWVPLVDDVSFSVKPGETLGLVGESGSGKSVSAMSLMGFIGRQRGQRLSGSAHFQGRDLLRLNDRELESMRGNEIAMVFQEPMTSLDPAFKVGHQIAAGIRVHQDVTAARAKEMAIEAMDKVRIPSARVRADSYPHEFSGGMRQRVLIAMAIANNPSMLIADEPTTALDVSVQAQILALLTEMKEDLGLAMIFITHNMGVVADICDRLAVMYAGQIVEEGDVFETFQAPQHPYTERLLAAMPSIASRRGSLEWIPGSPPRPTDFPAGCRFAPRCRHRLDSCEQPTTLLEISPGRSNRCLLGNTWMQESES